MAKVIVTIAPENDMFFEDILSFETENHIGIWSYEKDCYVLLCKSGKFYEPSYLKKCENLRELNEAVLEECDEHIEEVFDVCNYTIKLG